MKERIKEEETKPEEQNQENKSTGVQEDEEGEEDSFFADLLIDLFSVLLFYSFTARFAEYPYSPNDDFNFNVSSFNYPDEHRIANLQLSVDTSYLQQSTWGTSSKFSGHLTAINFNGFYQYIFSGKEDFYIRSLNGGLSFILPGVLLNGFAGVFEHQDVDPKLVSFGLSTQIYLPLNFILDIYNLNAYYHSLGFHYLSAMLNYAVWRANIGVGYNYNDYAGVLFQGPMVRFSFWL
ncbi:MAG: hypothetical protein GH155_00995 [Spirochaeta sp.]|nr:hypothetical protein [Spirochaeta sp.]